MVLDTAGAGGSGIGGAGFGGSIGTGQSVTTGQGGSGGSGDTGGGSCASLVNAFQAARQAALACDPSAPDGMCAALAPDMCGCPTPVNVAGNLASDDASASAAMNAAGCATECFGCPDPQPMFSQCLATPAGGQCGEGPG